jgi:zinc and cadmium transporter
MELLYPLLAAFLISLISFSGAVLFVVKHKKVQKSLIFFVALAAGVMLGTAFLHLIPESFHMWDESMLNFEFAPEEAHDEHAGDEHAHEEEGHSFLEMLPGIFILLGILIFYLIERFVDWHHHHDLHCEHHAMTSLSLIGDGFHNFLDGIVIAAAFSLNTEVGIITTLAIALHEIPQEIGDLSILLHGGFSKMKALLFNFGSGLLSLLGVLVGALFFGSVQHLIPLFIALSAGSFIYLALVDLVPEIHKKRKKAKDLSISLTFFLGILLVFLLTQLISH